MAKSSKKLRHSVVVFELVARYCLQLHPSVRKLGCVVWASFLMNQICHGLHRQKTVETFLTTIALVIPNTQVHARAGSFAPNKGKCCILAY